LRQEQEEREMREMTLDDWGNVANLMMALAAIAALLYAFVEVRSARDDSHEATAKEIWMQYHLYALQYPKLANPDSSKLDYEKWEYEGDTAQFDDYTWFVSFMLLACDELLRLRGDATDWDWGQIVKNNIGFHWDFIKSPAFEFREVISPRLRQQIEEMKTALPQAAART
jgi:hypothetical protein